MKTKLFQRTAAMLLCLFICTGTALPLMGAALAADENLHGSAEPGITCFCDIRCTADTLNADCPVCVQDVAACAGAEPEVPTGSETPTEAETPVETATPTEPETPAPVPACNCESKCELGAVKADCPVCKADLTGCTGKAPDPIPESNLSIRITAPSYWATNTASADFRITDETGSGFALVEVKIEKNGQWRDVTDSLEQRDNRWYGEIDLSENCTVYVSATGHDGKVYEKSRYIECFDRTAPTLRASIDGKVLFAEANDDLSGVEAIYIDGEKYTDLTNGTLDVALGDLPADYEQLSVQAVDAAGNKSKTVQVKNPNYQEEDKKQNASSGQTQPPQTNTAGTTTPTVSATTPPAVQTVPPTAKTTAPATTTTTKSTGGTKSSASASADPEEEADTTPRDPVPLTPDGQATVLDNAADEDGKEFYTIQTPDENVFYLVIDNQRDTENVYFLNAVTEADLMALTAKEDDTPQADAVPDPEPVCICTEQCAAGEVNTECPVCVLSRKDCTGKVPVTDTDAEMEPEEKPEKQKSGAFGTLILALFAALAAGGAGYYFKIYKPKKELDEAEDFDELTGGDEEETVNEDEEPDA